MSLVIFLVFLAAVFGSKEQEEQAEASQRQVREDIKHGSDPAVDGIPHYWDTSGNERPVELAAYCLLKRKPMKSQTLSHWRHPLEPTHTEVHVGMTAYSVFALKDDVQKFATRPTEVSMYFVKEYPKETGLFMCNTRKTDVEIYNYLKENFRGIYHITDYNCNDFSKFLLKFLCPKKSYPSQYNLFAKFGKCLHLTYKALRWIPYIERTLGPLDSKGYFKSGETDPNAPWDWIDLGHKIPEGKLDEPEV